MKILLHPRFWRLSGLLLLDGLVFGLSNPQHVPSFMLAAGFLLLVATFYQIILAVLAAADWYGLPGKAHRRRQARILTGVAGGLIALQSVGELGTRDILVAVPLALLVYLYISYGKGKTLPRTSQMPVPASLLRAD